MYKLLFDSDALIKASKTGLLDFIVQEFKVIITEEVYEESVIEGQKRLYEDAEKIEEFVKSGKIKVARQAEYNKRKKPEQNFGKGEASVFQYYGKGSIIVTDDLSFVRYVQKENIRNLSSAHLIRVLVQKNKLTKAEAYNCLDKLRPFIRKEIYNLVKKDIGGEK
jgi:predicted nucleic acid-binding protein